MAGTYNKDDRIPTVKLTVMQYIIAAILVILVSGLWRLQVLGAQNYRALAEANRIRKVPILAPPEKSTIATVACWSTIIRRSPAF